MPSELDALAAFDGEPATVANVRVVVGLVCRHIETTGRLADRVVQQDAEIAELRDGLAELTERLASVERQARNLSDLHP